MAAEQGTKRGVDESAVTPDDLHVLEQVFQVSFASDDAPANGGTVRLGGLAAELKVHVSLNPDLRSNRATDEIWRRICTAAAPHASIAADLPESVLCRTTVSGKSGLRP